MPTNNRLMIAVEIPHLRKALSMQTSHIAGRLRKRAEAEFASEGHVQIDDDAFVGIQDDGLESGQVRGWVAAWVFVEVPLVEPRQTPPLRDMRNLDNWDALVADRGRKMYRFSTPDGTYRLTPLFLSDGRFHGYNVSFEGRKIGHSVGPLYAALAAWEHQQEAQSDADIKAGRTTTFNNAAELIGHIQSEGRKIREENE